MIENDKETGRGDSIQGEDTTEDNASGETVIEAFMKAISGDPQFIQAKPSGKAFTFIGWKPPSRS